MAHTRWTDYETQRARDLIAAGTSEQEFQRLTGRSKSAAHMRIRYVDDPVFREKACCRALRGRQMWGAPESSQPHYVDPKLRVPGNLLADAERRLTAPRSITAIICGDPAPGFSALDLREPPRRPVVRLAESAGDWA